MLDQSQQATCELYICAASFHQMGLICNPRDDPGNTYMDAVIRCIWEHAEWPARPT